MFKAFCDLCSNECNPKNSGTRQFDLLKSRIGLEVIILHDRGHVPDRHICDDCMAELLFNAATRYTKSPTATRVQLDASDALAFRGKKIEISSTLENLYSSLAAITELDQQIKQLLIDVEKYIKEAEADPKINEEKMQALKAAAASIEAARLKREKAEQIQAKIDAEEYPDYLERVERRERLRSS